MSDIQHLQTLRNDILAKMSDLGPELSANQNASLDTLLLIAHNTGRTDLLQAAHERINGIAGPAERAEAYLDLLDEVEYLLRRQPETEPAPALEQPQDQGEHHEG